MDKTTRKEYLHKLEQGYSSRFRIFEISCLLLAALSVVHLAIEIAPSVRSHPFTLSALIPALLTIDFLSGLGHWAGDTWGSVSTPILGESYVRPFREHHVDPLALTRHDFIEANGATAFVALLVLVPLQLVHIPQNPWLLYLYAYLFFTFGFGILSNQPHVWAHAPQKPRLVEWMQKRRLLIPPRHHAIHHVVPFSKYYCVFLGWLNPLLTATNFFRHVERVITFITGVEPHVDDLAQIQMLRESMMKDSSG